VKTLPTPTRSVVLALVTTVVVASGADLLAGKFKSTWHAPGAGPLNFAGKKVVALVITDDQNLQVSAEEALSRELAARGVEGVPAYRMIPREELRDKDKAKGWFTRAAAAGVVVMRVVGAQKEMTYTPDVWASPYYGSLWGYYGYGWGSVYIPGSAREDTVVTIETLVFDVPKDKLLWAGVSEKTNPKGTQQVVKELVKEAIKEMAKVGLVPKGAS
jgi:hypothetical protein